MVLASIRFRPNASLFNLCRDYMASLRLKGVDSEGDNFVIRFLHDTGNNCYRHSIEVNGDEGGHHVQLMIDDVVRLYNSLGMIIAKHKDY